MTPDELRQNVDTIVLVMMENRSFDHLLGHLSLPELGGRPEVDGIASLDNPAFANPRGDGSFVAPFLANDDPFATDLPHERAFVAQQLAYAQATGSYSMNGFVLAYEAFTKTSAPARPPTMGILDPCHLPVTGFLAREFTVCNRWFSPLPTSTQPNRLMAFSGYATKDFTSSTLLPNQDMMFDWLDRHHVSWRVYSAGISFFALFEKMWGALVTDKFRPLSRLSYDVQHEGASFPQVVVVEPDYDDSPIHLSGHACDNHPPVPVGFGEAFVQGVYEAVTSNAARWAKTVMVLTYDEHGGFFDHVAPVPVTFTPPNGEFAPHVSTGPRVPSVLVSPFVARGGVATQVFDHTSVLQLFADRFGDGSYSAYVDQRRAQGVASLAGALGIATGRTAAPPLVVGPIPVRSELSTMRDAITDGQLAFANAIEQLAKLPGALEKFPEIAHWLAAP